MENEYRFCIINADQKKDFDERLKYPISIDERQGRLARPFELYGKGKIRLLYDRDFAKLSCQSKLLGLFDYSNSLDKEIEQALLADNTYTLNLIKFVENTSGDSAPVVFELLTTNNFKEIIQKMNEIDKKFRYPIMFESCMMFLLEYIYCQQDLNREIISIEKRNKDVMNLNNPETLKDCFKGLLPNPNNIQMIKNNPAIRAYFTQMMFYYKEYDTKILKIAICDYLKSYCTWNYPLIALIDKTSLKYIDKSILDSVAPIIIEDKSLDVSKVAIFLTSVISQEKQQEWIEQILNYIIKNKLTNRHIDFLLENKDKIDMHKIPKNLKILPYDICSYFELLDIKESDNLIIKNISLDMYSVYDIAKVFDKLIIFIGACDNKAFKLLDLTSLYAVLATRIYAEDIDSINNKCLMNKWIEEDSKNIKLFSKNFIAYLIKYDKQCSIKLLSILRNNRKNTFFAYLSEAIEKSNNAKAKKAVMQISI